MLAIHINTKLNMLGTTINNIKGASFDFIHNREWLRFISWYENRLQRFQELRDERRS